jgi:hypothetical protein
VVLNRQQPAFDRITWDRPDAIGIDDRIVEQCLVGGRVEQVQPPAQQRIALDGDEAKRGGCRPGRSRRRPPRTADARPAEGGVAFPRPKARHGVDREPGGPLGLRHPARWRTPG